MLRIATFSVDGTPPVGCGVGFGTGDPTTGVRDPLFLRGFVIHGARSRLVLLSADWCGITGSAREQLEGALSAGAGVEPDAVLLHCIHQHDAPLVDFDIDRLLGMRTYPRDWWDRVLRGSEAAVRAASSAMADVAEVGHAETRLRGYASNRRIVGTDGRVRGMRFSRCADPALVAEPVGTIDPMLRTLAFRAPSGRLLASMSFYATHPQVSNGRRVYSADAPGEAIRILTSRHPEGFHAFLTGAGGNVTAGKYSSPSDLEGNLLGFGRLLASGIQRNLAAMEWEPAEDLSLRRRAFAFPAAEDRRQRARAELRSPTGEVLGRTVAAAVLGSMEHPSTADYRMTLLSLGSTSVLFLPGEPFVEYQLMAQALAPDRFLAVAANCGDDYFYLPTAAAFRQGGYEVETFCWCTPEFEERYAAAVRVLLATP